jgi:site-specific DNA-methyltransferase (adenine-specific)
MKLFNGDCLELIKDIPDHSVDAIITDPPYLYLSHKLDKPFNQDLFFEQAYRVLKDNSFLVFFGRGKSFYYWNTLCDKLGLQFVEEIIWDKGQTSVPFHVLQRIHETIAVYRKGTKTINKVYINKIEYDLISTPIRIARDLNMLIQEIKKIKTIEQLNDLKDGKFNLRPKHNDRWLYQPIAFKKNRASLTYNHTLKENDYQAFAEFV